MTDLVPNTSNVALTRGIANLPRPAQRYLKARQVDGFLNAAEARIEAEVSAHRVRAMTNLAEEAMAADVMMHERASILMDLSPTSAPAIAAITKLTEMAIADELRATAYRMRS